MHLKLPVPRSTRHPGAPWCYQCSGRQFRRSQPLGHGGWIKPQTLSERLQKPGYIWLCHGSHVPSPGERTLIGNPEKSKNKNQPKFVLKNGKWETISSGSSDCGCDNPPIIRLEIKSHRPQIITTTVLRPCEPNNSHIEWDPTIRTTENWDLIDVEQDEHWIPPYVEGQFDDADEGSENSNPDRPSTVPDADHTKIDQLIKKIETLIKQTQEATYNDDNGLSNDPEQKWTNQTEEVSSNLEIIESGVSQLGTPNATRICYYYAKYGVCKRFRTVCPFAHVDPKQKMIALELHPNLILKDGKWRELESSRSQSISASSSKCSCAGSDEESEKSL